MDRHDVTGMGRGHGHPRLLGIAQRLCDRLDIATRRGHARPPSLDDPPGDHLSGLSTALPDVIYTAWMAASHFVDQHDTSHGRLASGFGLGRLEIFTRHAYHHACVEWHLCIHLRPKASAAVRDASGFILCD